MTYVKTHTYMGYNSKIPSYLSTEPLKPQDCVDLNQGHRCWRPQILVPLNCLIRSFFFLLRRVMFCFPIRQYLYINTIWSSRLFKEYFTCYLLTLFCKVIVRASMTSRPGFSIHSLIYLGCSLTGGLFLFLGLYVELYIPCVIYVTRLDIFKPDTTIK